MLRLPPTRIELRNDDINELIAQRNSNAAWKKESEAQAPNANINRNQEVRERVGLPS